MDTLDEFLRRLFGEGRVVFRGRPEPATREDERAMARLGRAYEAYRLEVAGPPIGFEPKVALAAAELVRQACWALVNRDDRPEALAKRLTMPLDPATPAHHLSADLTLRYLSQVERRARSLDPGDALSVALARLLGRWPLSGVLSDLADGPEAPPDFGGHPGLMLLYAERLARDERPAWRPAERGMEHLELVLRGLGRDRSALLAEVGDGAGGGVADG